jgi:hypothetical protein
MMMMLKKGVCVTYSIRHQLSVGLSFLRKSGVQLNKESAADAQASVKPPELPVFALNFPTCSKRHLLII